MTLCATWLRRGLRYNITPVQAYSTERRLKGRWYKMVSRQWESALPEISTENPVFVRDNLDL